MLRSQGGRSQPGKSTRHFCGRQQLPKERLQGGGREVSGNWWAGQLSPQAFSIWLRLWPYRKTRRLILDSSRTSRKTVASVRIAPRSLSSVRYDTLCQVSSCVCLCLRQLESETDRSRCYNHHFNALLDSGSRAYSRVHTDLSQSQTHRFDPVSRQFVARERASERERGTEGEREGGVGERMEELE